MRELTGAIADFPGERADGGESITAPEDELAAAASTATVRSADRTPAAGNR